MCRAMLKRVLTSWKYTCDEAEDGVIAVEKVRRSLAQSQGQGQPSSQGQPNSQPSSLRSAPRQTHINGPQPAVPVSTTPSPTTATTTAATTVPTTAPSAAATSSATASAVCVSVSVKPFDLILCDNIMPNMCGPEAVALMRKIGYRGPIFGVTGNIHTTYIQAR